MQIANFCGEAAVKQSSQLDGLMPLGAELFQEGSFAQ
jgi:hypothetical protein